MIIKAYYLNQSKPTIEVHEGQSVHKGICCYINTDCIEAFGLIKNPFYAKPFVEEDEDQAEPELIHAILIAKSGKEYFISHSTYISLKKMI